MKCKITQKKNIKYKNGDEYSGQIKNDKKHGYGIYKLNDGSKYKGQFLNDKAHTSYADYLTFIKNKSLNDSSN
jgi:hypothetical protein|tara:strand:- start:1176 stop:1394 length:219 start_codon:yes stop_codon:yes gene_type:complete